MADTQFFQLLGAFFSLGAVILVSPEFIKNILQELERSTSNMFYGGLVSLATGFFSVCTCRFFLSRSMAVQGLTVMLEN